MKTTFDEYCLVMLFRRGPHQKSVHLTNLRMSQITPNLIFKHFGHVFWAFEYFSSFHKFKMADFQSYLYWIDQLKSYSLPSTGFDCGLGNFSYFLSKIRKKAVFEVKNSREWRKDRLLMSKTKEMMGLKPKIPRMKFLLCKFK